MKLEKLEELLDLEVQIVRTSAFIISIWIKRCRLYGPVRGAFTQLACEAFTKGSTVDSLAFKLIVRETIEKHLPTDQLWIV